MKQLLKDAARSAAVFLLVVVAAHVIAAMLDTASQDTTARITHAICWSQPQLHPARYAPATRMDSLPDTPHQTVAQECTADFNGRPVRFEAASVFVARSTAP